MTSDSRKCTVTPVTLAPFLEGFYERVARQVGVDTSLVVCVALGEYESPDIEDALERELKAIANQHGSDEAREDTASGSRLGTRASAT